MACAPNRESSAPVLYASIDPPIAQSILDGSRQPIRATYDAESNKTAGLVARLRAERNSSRADVFWSGEFVQTQRLCDERVLLQGGLSNYARSADFGDPTGCWIPFAARLRVLIVAASIPAAEQPASVLDLTAQRWRGRAAIANPRFGTTGTHFSALYAVWGDHKFRTWVRALRANDVHILPGNAQVKDAVAIGRMSWGLTDSDDVAGAIQDGAEVRPVIPDQATGLGVFLIPNTVALVAGREPTPQTRALVEYLLSEPVEAQLARSRSGNVPIRYSLPPPAGIPRLAELCVMDVSYAAVAHASPAMLRAFEAEWPQ
jgi:iron(III) transport system substrate-binding protein